MTMTRQEQNENDHFFSFFELSEEFPSLALFFFFPVDEPEPELLPTDWHGIHRKFLQLVFVITSNQMVDIR